MDTKLIKIRIIEKWAHHKAGEIVKVFAAKAAEMVRKGIGEYVKESDVPTAKRDIAKKEPEPIIEKATVEPVVEKAEVAPEFTPKADVNRLRGRPRKEGGD